MLPLLEVWIWAVHVELYVLVCIRPRRDAACNLGLGNCWLAGRLDGLGISLVAGRQGRAASMLVSLLVWFGRFVVELWFLLNLDVCHG